jgi:amidophosphoribosyltransferase
MTNDKLREECAIFGTVTKSGEAAGITYNALLAMQHRGQEGAGIAVLNGNTISCQKEVGLVSEVFTGKVLSNFPESNFGIGHDRYSTTGKNTRENVQPFVTEFLKGRIATAHNGNIVNGYEIKEKLKSYGCDFSASSDSEVISSLIAYRALNGGNVEEAVISACRQISGAFSLVILSSEGKLIGVRDGYGFRPLCLGKNQYGYALASESCGLDSSGYEFVRDIDPGEMIVIDESGIVSNQIILETDKKGLCVFEYVYFSRPDSVIDNLSVYEARYNMGKILADEHPVDADMVCGVPDSGLEAAMGYSAGSSLPLVSGFVKNRYIGRSFIFPSQKQRDAAVKMKLNPLSANVKGKRIILVDDSIVRGTTSAKIISSMRNAGAKEVHMLISSPPFRHTCHFGTDIDSEENLIANQMTIEQIRQKIGADSLGFISADGLIKACEKSRCALCTGCFTGDYPIDIGNHTKSQLEEE